MCDEENKREGRCPIQVKFLWPYDLLFIVVRKIRLIQPMVITLKGEGGGE